MDETVSYHFATVKQRRENRHEIDYQLTLRQQPKQSRMCGVGEKADRRPIDPPPIVQLKVIDSKLSAAEKNSYLQNPYYFMYASLMAADLDEELHLLRDGKTRSTTGSVVSSLYHLKDIDNTDAGFFVFPDLSVRMEGSYRLKLSLFEIIEKEVFHCRSIISNKFFVYSAKKFPGMEESTFLSRSFADQGLKIRIRKELRQRRKLSKISDTEENNNSENNNSRNNNINTPTAAITSSSKEVHGASGKRARMAHNEDNTTAVVNQPTSNYVIYGSSSRQSSSSSSSNKNWTPPIIDHNSNRYYSPQEGGSDRSQQQPYYMNNDTHAQLYQQDKNPHLSSSNSSRYSSPAHHIQQQETSPIPSLSSTFLPYSPAPPPPPPRLSQISYFYRQQQNYSNNSSSPSSSSLPPSPAHHLPSLPQLQPTQTQPPQPPHY